jgi:HD-GYP domain-containing protein (c-di-GMP phosphodiesterase class II)
MDKHDTFATQLPHVPLEQQVERLELLYRVGLSLSAEKNKDRLVEMILLEAKALCRADGGTLYLRTEDDQLAFDMMHTDSLGLALGGTSGKPIDLPPVPLFGPDGEPNVTNVASCAAVQKRSFRIDDAYDTTDFDFSGTRAFDERAGYRSCSFLTIPLVNGEDRVIGVLQLINAQHPQSRQVIPFRPDQQGIVEALASQAAIALDNQLLLDAQEALLDSFIKMIAEAIDAKSPHTGGHCKRVPLVLEMLVEEACRSTQGPFEAFELNAEQWRELRIAAWLHDCGKIVTPVHVMDKGTKLESLYDRIESVRRRFDLLKRDVHIAYLEDLAAGAGEPERLERRKDEQLAALDDDLAFLERANIGGEFLGEADQARVREIGSRMVELAGELRPLLTEDEIANLSVSRGTLTHKERLIINQHMVQTIAMLSALPFPRNLRRVPEYAGGHHERMDGRGYPRGIFAQDMSIPARALAIADVFEALTAQDRPYKPGKSLSQAMRIMGQMKRSNHIDPALFDLFVSSGVYRRYGERYLPEELRDEVDEAALLAIEPEPYDLPEPAERQRRWQSFLPEYLDESLSDTTARKS